MSYSTTKKENQRKNYNCFLSQQYECNAKPFVVARTSQNTSLVLAFMKCMKNCALNTKEKKMCVLTWPTKTLTSIQIPFTQNKIKKPNLNDFVVVVEVFGLFDGKKISDWKKPNWMGPWHRFNPVKKQKFSTNFGCHLDLLKAIRNNWN